MRPSTLLSTLPIFWGLSATQPTSQQVLDVKYPAIEYMISGFKAGYDPETEKTDVYFHAYAGSDDPEYSWGSDCRASIDGGPTVDGEMHDVPYTNCSDFDGTSPKFSLLKQGDNRILSIVYFMPDNWKREMVFESGTYVFGPKNVITREEGKGKRQFIAGPDIGDWFFIPARIMSG